MMQSPTKQGANDNVAEVGPRAIRGKRGEDHKTGMRAGGKPDLAA